MRRGRAGFTTYELLFGIFIGGLLLLMVARLADVVDRVGDATRVGSDARSLESTTERVLGRALMGAGAGMPAAPNLAGIGVRMAVGPGGTRADTLIVLRGNGTVLPVASHGCRMPSAACLVLHGDQRARITAGDLFLVGGRGTGLMAIQVSEEPAAVLAPCTGSCTEALVCTVSPAPATVATRIIGSIREPERLRSGEPCPYAFFPDGSRCEEIEEEVAVQRQQPSCRAQPASTMYTEVRFEERTAVLGFPPPPVPLTTSGAGGVPTVRAVPVDVSRFWVRAAPGDTLLVRQNGLDESGKWRRPFTVAGPVLSLRVETLHHGAWAAGIGVTEADLLPRPTNLNYQWRQTPDASGRSPGFSFARGHHTVSGIRIQYSFHTVTATHGVAARSEASFVVHTPALAAGGDLDG